MRIRLVCVGKVKEPFAQQGCKAYLERLTRLQRIDVLEIPDSDQAGEGKKILARCEKMPIYAFSEEGEGMTSKQFAAFLKGLDGDVAFVIGGPNGLSPDVKKAAKKVISLSEMTFTHEMARMILLEQIYRALTIIKGMPYHR
jgi:23S rRNA (pseudouridine1915-N3)-methyltransferase